MIPLGAARADFADLQHEIETAARGVEEAPEPGSSALDELREQTVNRLLHTPELRELLAKMMQPTVEELDRLRGQPYIWCPSFRNSSKFSWLGA